jgi:NADH-quinone oxidoreductase subunit A
MTHLVFYLLVFFVVGVFFLFFHLMLGKLIRPARPDAEKLTIYECGEPTVGSAWVQFDLRYYVVALLFVIFDVEVAFFFPWAVVFGDANKLADPALEESNRTEITQRLIPVDPQKGTQLIPPLRGPNTPPGPIDADTGYLWGFVAFFDILLFFGILLVGFAYLWKRGDINWVRSTAAEAPPATTEELPASATEELVGAGR